jgi:hypothetical protein
MNTQIQTLEILLSRIARVPVEITIRGNDKFTFSFEGEHPVAVENLTKFIVMSPKTVKNSVSSTYDSQSDYTCIFFSTVNESMVS